MLLTPAAGGPGPAGDSPVPGPSAPANGRPGRETVIVRFPAGHWRHAGPMTASAGRYASLMPASAGVDSRPNLYPLQRAFAMSTPSRASFQGAVVFSSLSLAEEKTERAVWAIGARLTRSTPILSRRNEMRST